MDRQKIITQNVPSYLTSTILKYDFFLQGTIQSIELFEDDSIINLKTLSDGRIVYLRYDHLFTNGRKIYIENENENISLIEILADDRILVATDLHIKIINPDTFEVEVEKDYDNFLVLTNNRILTWGDANFVVWNSKTGQTISQFEYQNQTVYIQTSENQVLISYKGMSLLNFMTGLIDHISYENFTNPILVNHKTLITLDAAGEINILDLETKEYKSFKKTHLPQSAKMYNFNGRLIITLRNEIRSCYPDSSFKAFGIMYSENISKPLLLPDNRIAIAFDDTIYILDHNLKPDMVLRTQYPNVHLALSKGRIVAASAESDDFESQGNLIIFK